ncbi:MAG: hypothetical protein WAZ21_00455 [Candidatus Saccharimonadales bacterium]
MVVAGIKRGSLVVIMQDVKTTHDKHNTKGLIKIAAAILKTDLAIAIAIAITWQILFTFIGSLFDASLNNIFQRNIAPPTTLLSHTYGWDSGWYEAIIKGAYSDPTSAASVFYPLFPLLVKTIHIFSFEKLDILRIGLLINTTSLALAIYSLKKIAGHFLPANYHWWLPILFITSPAAIFMHLFYTEALFCGIAFGAYMFALQRKWLYMGILLGLLTATRLPAILIIGLCGLEFIRSYNWNIKAVFNKNLLYFLLAPIGYMAYGIYLYIVRGDFFSMSNGYKLTNDWPYQVFNPNIFETFHSGLTHLYSVFTSGIPFDEGQSVNFFIPIVGLFLLLATSFYAIIIMRKSIGIPLGIFGIVAIVFFTINSNFISVGRYLLPCVVIYISILHLAIRNKALNGIFYLFCYGGVLLQAYLLILFVNGYFAG